MDFKRVWKEKIQYLLTGDRMKTNLCSIMSNLRLLRSTAKGTFTDSPQYTESLALAVRNTTVRNHGARWKELPEGARILPGETGVTQIHVLRSHGACKAGGRTHESGRQLTRRGRITCPAHTSRSGLTGLPGARDIIIPILCMEKQKLRGVRYQYKIAQNWDLGPGTLTDSAGHLSNQYVRSPYGWSR